MSRSSAAACLLLSFTLLALSGCGATRKTALDASANGSSAQAAGDSTALLAQATEAWKLRGDRAHLEAAIAAWRKALEVRPDDATPAMHLARAYYFLADGHLRFDIEDESERKRKMGDAFGEGQFFGEKALLIMSDAFGKARQAEKPMNEALKNLGPEAIPAVYWWAANLGKWAATEGFITLLSYKDQVKQLMDFCMETNERYFYGAPHRYFGAYFTKIPIPGGDKAKSRKHFDKAVQDFPSYLATRVLLAEFHAIKFQDRALFKTHLEYVLATDSAVIAELVPEHDVEKRKAKALLDDIDEYFE